MNTRIMNAAIEKWTASLRERIPDADPRIISAMMDMYRQGWLDCQWAQEIRDELER